MRFLLVVSLFAVNAPLVLRAAEKPLFQEDFGNNKANWPGLADTATRLAKIEGGKLYWENRDTASGSNQHARVPLAIDPHRDYRVTATLRYLGGNAEGDFGIQWQRDTSSGALIEMTIDGAGNFEAWRYESGHWVALTKKNALPLLKLGEPNTIQASKIGGSFYFSANDEVFSVGSAPSRRGSQIGVVVDAGVTAEIDDIRVEYLEPSEGQRLERAFVDYVRRHPEIAHPLIEEFDDNRHNWPYLGDREKSFAEIVDGVLLYENLSLETNTSNETTVFAPIDVSRDWSIDLRLKHVSGRDDIDVNLVFGRHLVTWARHLHGFSGNQWYKSSRTDGKNWTAIIPWTKDETLVKTGDFNTLSVRKIGSAAYFLVNGEPVGVETIHSFPGDQVGIGIPAGVTIEADSLRVQYLFETQAERQVLSDQLSEKLHARRIAQGPALDHFVETFDDNRNGWPWIQEGDSWSGQIVNGALHWANRSPTGAQISFVPKPINTHADYELTLSVSHLGGPDDNGIGLIFGRSDDGKDEQTFAIAANGHYHFATWKGGVSDQRIPWTEIDLLKSGLNTLAVRKVDDNAYLYINGQLLADIRAPELSGPGIGITVSKGISAAFDDLGIRYFPRSRSESIALKHRLDEELQAVYRGGKVKGAIHTMAAARDRDEAEAKMREAEQLTDADQKQLNKVRKQFRNKSKLSLLGSWKRPVNIMGDPTMSHRIYYNYKQKGRKQYYYEFHIIYVGSAFDMHGKPIPLKQDQFKIDAVQLTDRMW